MKISRRSLWWLLLLIPLLWLLGPKEKEEQSTTSEKAASTSTTSQQSKSVVAGSESNKEKGKTARHRDQNQEQGAAKVPPSAEVDAILVDESLTEEQAASKLRDIAGDASFPLPQREEALQHGLNLGPAAFGDFAEGQVDLPRELAEPLLQAMINFNESPVDQIRTYLALKNHADPEIAEQALEMLAFMVEDDERKETPERLEQLAREKIQMLSQPAQE